MADKDYYKTLGVSRGATEDEIRKAYKKLVRQHHPDRNPNDEQAAETFKNVQEAWDVLGDAEKRAQYDRYGAAFQGGRAAGGPQGWNPAGGGAGPIDLGDLFGGSFDLGDLFGGGPQGGFGRSSRGAGRPPTPSKGEDARLESTVPFQIAAVGGNHGLQLQRDGETERLNVRIPAGVNDGDVIRLAGQGNPGRHGGPAGDLRLTVRVAAHPWFKREGNNLLLEVPVTPSEAALGARVDVPTLSEGRVTLTIPAGTSGGAKLRLREKGVVDRKSGKPGDQIVVVKIVVPKELDDETRRLYEQLAASQSSPRDGAWPG